MSEHVEPAEGPAVVTGDAARRRLRDLGVDPERLFEALDAGDVAARQADVFSPVTAAGTLRWLETVRMLRQGLVTDDWVLNDDRNSPRVISPSGDVAIVPVSGTAETGLLDGTPKTANARGAASSRAVQINGQLEFSYQPPLLPDMAGEKSETRTTWFLLYYRSHADELRAELSLPIRISDKGIVGAWRERIILPSRSFGADQMLPRDAGGNDDVEFDIAAL